MLTYYLWPCMQFLLDRLSYEINLIKYLALKADHFIILNCRRRVVSYRVFGGLQKWKYKIRPREDKSLPGKLGKENSSFWMKDYFNKCLGSIFLC